MNKEKGFILNFTLLFVGVMLLIVVITSNSTFAVLQSAQNEVKSLRAFYAADTGAECVRFHDANTNAQGDGAFDPMREEATYSCIPGQTFQAGFDNPTDECVEHEYSFDIELSNGSCATVNVAVQPNDVVINGENRAICTLRVFSRGKSSCESDSGNVVERTRWIEI